MTVTRFDPDLSYGGAWSDCAIMVERADGDYVLFADYERLRSANVGTMTPKRRLEIEQIANKYGSANCWTGTTGTLAAIIREILAELDKVKNGKTCRSESSGQD